MKLKDIEVGGRYEAKVSGRVQVVRVVELKQIPPASWSARDAWRTIIIAVNESTGRKITVRSPQRLRPLPVRRIGQIDRVEQLAAGERAFPEHDVEYDLRLIDGAPLGVEVAYVSRRDEQVIAHTHDGREFPVTGTGAYILCPRNKKTA
jgi:hypothetical protein